MLNGGVWSMPMRAARATRALAALAAPGIDVSDSRDVGHHHNGARGTSPTSARDAVRHFGLDRRGRPSRHQARRCTIAGIPSTVHTQTASRTEGIAKQARGRVLSHRQMPRKGRAWAGNRHSDREKFCNDLNGPKATKMSEWHLKTLQDFPTSKLNTRFDSFTRSNRVQTSTDCERRYRLLCHATSP